MGFLLWERGKVDGDGFSVLIGIWGLDCEGGEGRVLVCGMGENFKHQCWWFSCISKICHGWWREKQKFNLLRLLQDFKLSMISYARS